MENKQIEFRGAAWIMWGSLAIGGLIAIAMSAIVYIMNDDILYLVRTMRVLTFLALVGGVCTWLVDVIIGKIFKDEE